MLLLKPTIILVDTQLAENIGLAARAMYNFGLANLFLVRPKIEWPSEKAAAVSVDALPIINNVKSVDELQNAWSNDDYIQLLSRFGFEDAEITNPSELLELLFMAISDFEPEEAAAIILDYKLSNDLNENQIEQISHEMLLDKISEEYADISLHHQLFNINQLLYKAFNGTFPNAKATIIEFEISPNKNINKALEDSEQRIEIFSQIKVILNEMNHEERIEVIQMMWGVILADGVIDDFEANLMRRMNGLLYVSGVESATAKENAMSQLK